MHRYWLSYVAGTLGGSSLSRDREVKFGIGTLVIYRLAIETGPK